MQHRVTSGSSSICTITRFEVGGAHRTADIADGLGVKITSLGPVRANLIQKGMIYSPAHGDMAFTVPLFDEFMKRTIPKFEP